MTTEEENRKKKKIGKKWNGDTERYGMMKNEILQRLRIRCGTNQRRIFLVQASV
jgi:hypothetical protein